MLIYKTHYLFFYFLMGPSPSILKSNQNNPYSILRYQLLQLPPVTFFFFLERKAVEIFIKQKYKRVHVSLDKF